MGCQTVYCASCNLCRMQTVYSKLFAFWSLARDAVITPRSLWRVTAILMQDCAFSHCVLSTATVWLKKSRCTISKCFQETLAVTVTEDGLLHGLLVRINPSGCWLFKIWLSFVFVIWWLLLEQPHPVSISRHTMQNLLATHPRVRQVQSGMLVCQSLSGQAPLYLAEDCRLVSDSTPRSLRSSDVSTCVVLITLSSYGDRTFAAAGPCPWNSLPVQLRNPDIPYGLFRRQLKGHLFREAWTRRSVTSNMRRHRKTLTSLLASQFTNYSNIYLPGFRERVGAAAGSAASAIWSCIRTCTTTPGTINPT